MQDNKHTENINFQFILLFKIMKTKFKLLNTS